MTDLETVTVVVERDFSHAPDKVWRALTQPHLIEAWLMKNDFALQIGHHFKLRGEWGGVLDCEVLEIAEKQTLAYRWDYPNDDPAFDLKSVVTFTLTPIPTGTRLRMEQSGFRTSQKQASGGARHGWNQFLANLEKLLEQTVD